jgi:oxygen-independent coproporphyrinogen-3 oxidase
MTRSLKPFVFRGYYQDQLSFEDIDNLGLYVHIPFCRSLCGFCPYCKEVYDYDTAVRYKEALLLEIDLVCKNMKSKKKVTSLYFGGGTPALFVDWLREIIEKLQQYFEISGGIGVELHPDDITQHTLTELKKANVSMVSIGIQSFDETCLNKLGRKKENLIEKLKLVQSYSFSVMDVDLIFGIPGQNKNILKSDIDTAFEYGATQISTYPFIDFTFANNVYKPLPRRKKKEMLQYLNELRNQSGMERTSVWTFAKKNTEKYSSVTRDAFLGFGVSATTLLRDIFKINTFSVNEYIKRVKNFHLPTSLTLNFTQRQRGAYFLFWSAYGLQIDANRFHQLIGQPLTRVFGLELFIARIFKLIVSKKGAYFLTDRASYLYHHLEQQYTTAYIDKMWNISRNIAFPQRIVLK